MLAFTGRSSSARLLVCSLLTGVIALMVGASPAAAVLPGSVYTMTNEAAGNEIVVFSRGATGALTELTRVAAGGNGEGNSPPFGLDHLDSQGAVELSDSQHLLFAVNAGSDSLSSFRVLPGGGLVRVSTVPVGDYPISVDSFGNRVYVLNQGELNGTDDATEGTIQGFTAAADGTLTAIAASTQPLSVTGSDDATPAEISFDRTGATLTVTHRFPAAAAPNNRIDTFVLNAAGAAGPRVINTAAVSNPFGHAFDLGNRLIVTNVFASSVSTYNHNTTTGALTLAAGGTTATPGGGAPCWIAITPNGNFAFVGNTGSGNISRLSIAADGTTTFLGLTAVPGAGLTADVVVSPDGNFLTVISVNGGPGGLDNSETDTYAIGANGSLTLVNPGGRTPATLSSGVTGLAASAADSTAPDTAFTSGPAAGSSTSDSTPTFGLGTVPANEPNPTFTCKVDAGADAPCTSPFTTASLAEGAHTVTATATDFGGNTDATPVTRTFTVDTVAPDTAIDAGPPNGGSTSDTTPTFGFTSTEAGSTFRCRVDAGAFAACATPFTTAALAAGSHSFFVAAVDAAGNLDATPAARTFTVESSVPKRPQPGCTTLVGTQRVGTNGANTINGGAGVDIIFGLGGKDILRGLGNRDCLYGGSANDSLSGGAGADRLFGDAGNDSLNGSAGADSLTGGSGADRLTDTSGKDSFSGGTGNDMINSRDGTRSGRRIRDTVRCGAGRDRALVDRRDTVSRDCERVSRR